jgi:hypothetical protein
MDTGRRTERNAIIGKTERNMYQGEKREESDTHVMDTGW